MDQVINGSQHRTMVSQKRASWFVAVILLLVLCAAIGVAVTVINSAKTSMRRDVMHQLEAQAQNRTAAVTVWYGTLQSQITRLAEADMFRLYASEINAAGKNLTQILRLWQNSEVSNGDDEISQLASQMPLMRNLLREFATSARLQSARLVNSEQKTYLSTDENPAHLTTDQHQAVSEALNTGLVKVLPVRALGNDLLMDIVQPVFAPHYVEGPTTRPVGALLLTLPVAEKISELMITDTRSGQLTRILQVQNGTLSELVPQGLEPVRALPSWTPAAEGGLAFDARKTPAKERLVYVLGQDVPGLPWIVAQEVLKEKADETFMTYRSVVILVTVISTSVVLLFVGMIWWWMVGRRERSISRELTQLYHTVNEQKRLLDGINSALPDGIVLTNTKGLILYANQGFASMVSRPLDALNGLDGEALFGYDTAKRIGRYMEQVLVTGEPVTFTEIIWLRSKKNHYQVACSPYKDADEVLDGVVAVYRNITEIIEANQRNQAMVQQTVNVLMRAIEAVDPYLRGQSAQTGQLAGYLTQRLGLDTADEATVRTAANLFQIGMIRLPHELLNKTTPLTPEERNKLEQHVEYARTALEGIDFGLPVLEAICQMHECLDGSGYPKHLKGGEIAIHARILAVANTFCALIRPRAYRQAKSVEDALTILSMEPLRYDLSIINALHDLLATSVGEKFVMGLRGEETAAPKRQG